ncbi:MAG: right-handed parallel beta-helix repeat-containing protein [Candidatus Coatesbacteria bacterium]|nr:right-handed parallel beta-helix repeat-containing protein [Candidatus Coatesbacteria bacterium]
MKHVIHSGMDGTLVSVVVSLVAVLTLTASAGPTVTIYTDSDTYVAGDAIEVSLSTDNPGPGMAVAVYIGLLMPDGTLYTLGPGGWTNSVQPWISSIFHPGAWGLPRTVLWTFDVPSAAPPGAYIFASVLTHPWTFDYVCDPSFAPFSILSVSDLWVDGATGNDSNDGSEASPFRTIAHALDVASGSAGNPVTIHVAPATYAASTNGETFPLNMESWVSLLGEDRDTTILDAENAAYHVIYCDGVNNMTMEGFTMTGGNASEVGLVDPDACGGGIYLNESSPIIQNNIITGNTACRYGGGICCFFFSAPTVQHNVVWANWAKYQGGGGISCLDNSSPAIVNNIILDNWLTGDFEGGGGIDCRIISSPTIRNNTLVANEADLGGDGIYCDLDSLPAITDCVLWGNGDMSASDDLEGCSASYSCIEDLDAGVGNIHDDPLFVPGPLGDYYLDPGSLCIDAGNQSAAAAALDDRTTQADGTPDTGVVDMGYHYPITAGEAPTAYIDSIAPNPAMQGYDSVDFMGHGEDTDGSVVAYQWSSDLDGILSTDEDFTVEASALSIGHHLISCRVQDDDGLWSGPDTADLVIEAGNIPPTATIDDIRPNPAWQCEHDVIFVGHGEDADGSIVAYEWSSDLDGILSTNIDYRIEALDLSLGEHTISFRVQDNEGAWSLPDTRLLTIEPGSRLYVDAATGDDSNGGSEADPFLTITHALDIASGTDKCPVTIFVAGGTYSETTNGERFPLVMKSWVSIIGESSKTTTLDAHGKAHHIIYCDSVVVLTVQGFTITGGNTAGATEPDSHGAGIFCANSSPTIRENVITNNQASGDRGRGGAIYCLKGSPVILSNTITENTADTVLGCGGGICCDNSSPTISTNTISGNLAGDAFGAGGGIYCRDGSPSIHGNALSVNGAGWGGGIACVSTGSPRIEGNTISTNTALYGGGLLCSDEAAPLITENDVTSNTANYGGGVGCYGGLPTIEQNTISENEAAVGAGIYCAQGGSQTILHNQIESNSATQYGGGAACAQSSPELSYNNILSNTADRGGGGIYCYENSSAVIRGNLIYDNEVFADESCGGGIYCLEADSPSISENTIWCNQANGAWSNGGGIACNSCPVTIEHNIVLGNIGDGEHSEGGGIYVCGSAPITIHNNVVASNISRYLGGGIGCAHFCAPLISNNTLVDNWAREGGGIAYPAGDPLGEKKAAILGDAVIINCILWANGDDLFNCSATYCCIEDLDAGAGNIHTDPLFQTGDLGDYYLSCIAAGQAVDSDCIDAGSMTTRDAGLANRTTRTDTMLDEGTVDLGFHYRTGWCRR